MLFIPVYVDDILITGNNSSAIQDLIHKLNRVFALKTLRSVHIFLDLRLFAPPLCFIFAKQNMPLIFFLTCSTPMNLAAKLFLNDSSSFSYPSLYRSTIGALQYLSHTRPDITYAVNKLSQFLHVPTIAHWVACKRILPYIKGTLHHCISYKPTSVLSLDGFSNADWATSLDDRKSMSGLCLFLGENLITWSFKKQTAIAKSST